MRLTPVERLVKNLKGEIPNHMRREFLPKEVTYCRLKAMTNQDFGLDAARWEQWVTQQQAAGVLFRVPRP